jgi:hypothetical protein
MHTTHKDLKAGNGNPPPRFAPKKTKKPKKK